ncbi:MAG: SPOR domain-containing protein [Bacteroidaceae bacterium]|nr:SPOR domain-containing protein [Bacteroidaceae bacterium]
MRLLKILSVVGLFFMPGYLMGQQVHILDHLMMTIPNEGSVIIYQDSRIRNLLGTALDIDEETGERKTQKIAGFRVQVYAGNNSQRARTEALQVGEKVKELFPQYQVYTVFVSPRWLCRIGDYRTIEEADAVMRELKECGAFKELSIVRSLIEL